MSCNETLVSYLRDWNVPFQEHQHGIAFTAQQLATSEHLPSAMVAKVVMVFADADMIMLVVPASYHADLTKVAAILGATNVWLAAEQEFAELFSDCELGAMPPFGNLYGVPVYVDRRLSEHETIVFPAGTHTDTIYMRYRDYARIVHPQVVDIVRAEIIAAGHF